MGIIVFYLSYQLIGKGRNKCVDYDLRPFYNNHSTKTTIHLNSAIATFLD